MTIANSKDGSMSQVAAVGDRAVARSLKVLVPLIKADFENAEKAGMDYYMAAGEKLVEAREGHFYGKTAEFYVWADGAFGKKREQIRTYMALVRHESAKSFESLEDFKRKTDRGGKPTSGYYTHREWTVPVDDVAAKARKEAFRLMQEDVLNAAQEREAERKLAHRLIDIGFKVLAKELHPDKLHGDREAMRRLNRVREVLKGAV
jgi:hypothetical protein